MIHQEEPVAQRQEMVIGTLVLLWKCLMVVVKQGSGPGENHRGSRPVEYRGNLSIHLLVCLSIHQSPKEPPHRLAQAPQRLA